MNIKYKPFLRPVDDNKTKVYCMACKQMYNVNQMHGTKSDDHLHTVKHLNFLN